MITVRKMRNWIYFPTTIAAFTVPYCVFSGNNLKYYLISNDYGTTTNCTNL